MKHDVRLSTNDLVSGLKRYRILARQDLLRAKSVEKPEVWRRHAEARLDVYYALTRLAERRTPEEVVAKAVERYREVPLVSETLQEKYVRFVAEEHAFENFFKLCGIEPEVSKEARLHRPKIVDEPLAVS
ncbi:MAG: hypothetical protein JSV66_16715 [Trueperaceae bacterium]|nr:MAG: hypothetical protein JSV66_16715 [Trueperaceae bacterium]